MSEGNARRMIVECICLDCGGRMDISVGEKLVRGRILWHCSWHCRSCGSRIEEDGGEPVPEEVRRMILQSNGAWELRITEQPHNLPAVLKRLRETLRLSLLETARLKTRIPGTVFTGTRAEAERLREALHELCRVSVVKMNKR
jgi:hypothetical protein